MEIAAGDGVDILREDQRIVRDGVAFDREHLGGLAQLGEAGAHDLGLAAHGIRVLHLVAVAVRGADLAHGPEQEPVGRGRVDLAAVAADRVDARVERPAGAEHGLVRQGAADHGGGEEILGLEEAAQGEGGGNLGAVQEREPFLGRQFQRLEARDLQRLAGGQDLAAVARLALAEQHHAHMGERREVARCAHRALAGDAGIDLGVDQRDQRLQEFAADTRMAAPERVHLEHHDQADHGVVDEIAEPGRMRQDQRALQELQVLPLDAGIGQQAEAGVDAVDRPVLGDDLVDCIDRRLDRGVGGAIQPDLDRLLVDPPRRRQCHGAGSDCIAVHEVPPAPISYLTPTRAGLTDPETVALLHAHPWKRCKASVVPRRNPFTANGFVC